MGIVRVWSLAFGLAASGVVAEERLPARLAGHAFLPAATVLPPPADAPPDSAISAKFTGPARVDVPESVPGRTGLAHGRRPTGIALPFAGQPVQGFSGFPMAAAADGSLLVVSDNGFGSKRNSADYLLVVYRLRVDFATGEIEVLERIHLRDPDRIVPFRIVTEGSAERYLTGADFDPESLQVRGDTLWIGDEFGPFLLSARLDGRITGLFPAKLDGADLRSPQHPAIFVPATAGEDYTVGNSAGFEGLALTPDGTRLWAMLERPLLGADGKPEGDVALALAFDPEAGVWTGERFGFRLGPGAVHVGDFNFVDATRALVIERDNNEGDPSLACPGDPAPDCFPNPAEVKRVVLIDTASLDADGVARRIAHIDLMDIADPDGLARLATAAARDLTGRFTFPFTTVESVRVQDAAHILVGMDNNLPNSTGRALDRAADNEVILLHVPELLAAR